MATSSWLLSRSCNENIVKVFSFIVKQFDQPAIAIVIQVIHTLHVFLGQFRFLAIMSYNLLAHDVLIGLRDNSNQKVKHDDDH